MTPKQIAAQVIHTLTIHPDSSGEPYLDVLAEMFEQLTDHPEIDLEQKDYGIYIIPEESYEEYLIELVGRALSLRDPSNHTMIFRLCEMFYIHCKNQANGDPRAFVQMIYAYFTMREGKTLTPEQKYHLDSLLPSTKETK